MWSVHDAVLVEKLRKPTVVVVTEEFTKFAAQLAELQGHNTLPQLVLPYPLESRSDGECRAIAHEYYPALLKALGVTT